MSNNNYLLKNVVHLFDLSLPSRAVVTNSHTVPALKVRFNSNTKE